MTLSVRRPGRLVLGWALLVLAACGKDRSSCPRCGTVVIAATGDPSHLLPPLAVETVARDIGDQVYERLADLAPGAAPIDAAAYRPALASRWERVDSLSWRFHLRPSARWQDGRPVTAEDVRFSFEAFADSVLDAPARPYLAGRSPSCRRTRRRCSFASSRCIRSSSTTPPITCASSRATSGPGSLVSAGRPTPPWRT